jgi:V/A-type H+-transporting ATPase subunit D
VRVRHPPGRAGRPWLAHRLEVARRGAELLDEKFRALVRERARLEPEAARAREDWERCAREAETWLTRAAVMSGERQLALAAAGVPEPLEVTVQWRTVLGVTCPSEAAAAPRPASEPLALGGGAALLSAAAAHRRAVQAALRVAVADGALRRIDSELHATRLRRNAIQRKWIPAHEEALQALELTLEELEREDGARLRRVTQAASRP